METTQKARKRGVGQATRQPATEEYKPPYDWTEDPTNHVLLLDLTGFKKDDLKLQIDNSDKITASGERAVSENKRIWFKQIFLVPEGSDVSKMSGKFDNGLLFVIIPKKETEKKDEDQKVAQKDTTKEEMPKEETDKKVTQKDGTKEEKPKEETEKMVTKKDGTKEEMPTEKKEGIQKSESMKEGMPARKEQEKVQKETAMEEAMPTKKEQDKTMEEGMPKDEEPEEVRDDITAKAGIPTEEEAMSTGKKVEEMPEDKKEEEIPDGSTEEEMQTKTEEEPEEDGGSRGVSKDGPKDGSDDTKEESKIGGRRDVKKKCEEGHKFKDFGEKMYEKGKELLGDDFCDRVMKKINDNKAVIATAVVAFSLGFYVSSKLKRSE